MRAGGTTSIDVTNTGIDKAYGTRWLMAHRRVGQRDHVLRRQIAGRRHVDAAISTDIDCICVSDPYDSALAVEAIVKVT